MADPQPDMTWAHCDDCDRFTRVFAYDIDYELCLPCFRDLVDAVIETATEEGNDAAA